ncbi:flavodoxin [[Pantoea] beijingensis]|uniref:Flavodoxin n=1 Tax=[Pantoea] beijingensis TaxID=1324864 RepID=A0A443ICI3_9GAMM|nr:MULTISPECIES: flavodoxin [Erwiniaceae]RWR01763.1 flavodoxin [[Pantoea] beijingensis]
MAQVGIFVGTVYGNALLVAEEAEPILQDAGHDVKIFEDPTLSDWQNYADKVALIVTSTTGQGDFPDSIAPLFHSIKDKLGHQPGVRYGVIALGDSSYDNYCGAGKTFDALLQEHGATRIGEVLTVDATEYPEPEEVTSPWVENWATLF